MKMMVSTFISIVIVAFLSEFGCSKSEEGQQQDNLQHENVTIFNSIGSTFEITSDGYPWKNYRPNSSYAFHIKKDLPNELDQEASQLLVTVYSLAIEESSACTHDGLIISDDKYSTQVLCGIQHGRKFSFESDSVSIKFYSNGEHEDKGFHLRVSIIPSKCSKTIQGLKNGTISSPNYPEEYNSNDNCIWKIMAPEGMRVRLDFTANNFSIASRGITCNEDFLTIGRTGSLRGDTERYCDSNSPGVQISEGSSIIVKFQSDPYENAHGFRASFKIIHEPDIPPVYANGTIDSLPGIATKSCPCGRENRGARRIMGGEEVNPPNRYPWLTALTQIPRSGSPASAFCGGSLINNLYILTAAHCLEDYKAAMDFRIRVGLHDQRDVSVPHLIPSRVISHPEYNSRTQANDIALVRLAQPIAFTKSVSPICLPTSDQECRSRSAMMVAGWGKIGDSSSAPVTVKPMEVTLPTVTNSQCQDVYGGLVTDRHLCASLEGKDACQGDSGGPGIMIGNSNDVQCGVVSFGIGCGRRDYPGVYTLVSKYANWIADNTRDATYCLPEDNVGSAPPSERRPGPEQPNYSNCGIVGLNRQRRIAGGTETQRLEFPWVAAISYKGRMLGSGSLLALNVVLTSASIIKEQSSQTNYDSSYFRVIVGGHDITQTEPGKVAYRVKRLFTHPYYGYSHGKDYDFAILELSPQGGGFSTHVRPVCLPRTNSRFAVGTPHTVAGWGRVATSAAGSYRLRKTTLNLADRNSCQYTYRNQLTNRMLCAGGDGWRDTCFGDGGAGLMSERSDGRMYLTGVASWGWETGCAVRGKPSVFADVRYALPWIQQMTGISTA